MSIYRNEQLYLSVSNGSLYSKMTMEVILATAFGRTIDVQGGKGGKLHDNANAMIRGFESGGGPFISIVIALSSMYCTSMWYVHIYA